MKWSSFKESFKLYILPFLLYFLISIVIMVIWFRHGHIYGGGDVGLPTYNPSRIVGIAKYLWWEAAAPGFPVPHGVTSIPLESVLSLLQKAGFSPVALQFSLFSVLFVAMGFGMYILSLSIFGKNKFYLSFVCGLFYMFNPYMMVQIWHRFVHTAFFLVASLPYLLLLWKNWISQRNVIYLFLFLLTNFIAGYLYGTIGFNVTIWLTLTLITLVEIFIPWQGQRHAIKLVANFLVGFIFWLITNTWWLIPSFGVGSGLFAQQHSPDESLVTLLEISKQSIVPYTLQMLNPFYVFDQKDWGEIYNNFIFRLLPWIFVFIAFVGFVTSLIRKGRAKWAILFLVTLYLTKGAASPFGFPYILGFTTFFQFGVIRNPFEKVGIILPLFYTVIFGYGLWILYEALNTIHKKLSLTLLLLVGVFLSVYLWPMFTGHVIGKVDKLALVEIPEEYPTFDGWIRDNNLRYPSKDGLGRILHLPLTRSEAIKYNWRNGYNGVEPSQLIFSSLPSISRGFNLDRVDDTLYGLSLLFHKPNSTNQEAIKRLLKNFNVRYILLHKDVEWLGGQLYNPKETEVILDGLQFFKKRLISEKLVLYELDPNEYQSKVYLSKNIELVYPSDEITFWPFVSPGGQNEIITPLEENQDEKLLDLNLKGITIFSKKLFLYKEVARTTSEEIFGGLTPIRLLPNSPIYPIVKLREKLNLIGRSNNDKKLQKIIYADKRITELYKLKRLAETQKVNLSIDKTVQEYQGLLKEIFKDDFTNTNVFLNNVEIKSQDLFLRHLYFLQQISSSVSVSEKEVLDRTIMLLRQLLNEQGLLAIYPLSFEKGLVDDFRQIHRFEIPRKLKYELFMMKPQSKTIYLGELSELAFQIDNQTLLLKGQQKGLISYGEVELDKGIHEISHNLLPSKNLFNFDLLQVLGDIKRLEPEVVQFTSGRHDVAQIETEIDPALGGDTYRISFQSKVNKGRGFRLQLLQDTDTYDPVKKETVYQMDIFHAPTFFDKEGWAKFVSIVPLRTTTQKAKLRIIVEPWNDCVQVLNDEKKCANKDITYQYEELSSLLFKDIKVERILNNQIFLRSKIATQVKTDDQLLEKSFVKYVNPTKYIGEVTIEEPVFLFFNETYHSGWRLKLTSENEIYFPVGHYLGNLYGNAWYIDKKGKFNFEIDFAPQRSLQQGIIVSSIGWLAAASLVILKLVRKVYKDDGD